MDFRKKLLVLTVSAMSFAGMAYGDACGAAQINPTPAPPNLLRLEGTAELVTDVIVQCTGDTLAATTGQFIASLGLPVTSKQVSAGPPAVYEATLQINVGGTVAAGVITGGTNTYYQGAVSGSTVVFGTPTSAVSFPTTAYNLRIANIRVNGSSGANATYVAESLLATNEGVVIYASTPINVGYIQQGFAVPTISTGSVQTGLVICTANPAKPTPAKTTFGITLAENFGGAFKTQTGAGTCGTGAGAGPCTETNGEQGSYQGGGGIGTANSGTLFLFSFANISSGETIYMPLTFTSTSPTTLTFTLITSLTNTTPVTVGTSPIASYAALTSANGAATAVYDVTATDNTVLGESATAFGYITANPGFATATVAPITVTVTPAPTGSINPTLVIPNFTTSSNPALTLAGFNVCQTSLLFPFVTSQLGFDTGIAISNTTTDPFGTTPTPGSCTLNFYGSGAPTPNTNVAIPGGTVASGSSAAFQLGGSGVAAGFQGYMIAQCNFLLAHGYAFIQDGTGNNAIVQGYVANVFGTGQRGITTAEEVLGQ